MRYLMNPMFIFCLVPTLVQARGLALCEKNLIPLNSDFDRGTYIAIGLQTSEYESLRPRAEAIARRPLKSRGEAHLTVVSPPEYVQLSPDLRRKLVEALKALPWASGILKPICLGKGSARVRGQAESTYFVVMDAPALQKIRAQFGLPAFYPHVTVGFTVRDLHFEDGVRKDATSCLPPEPPTDEKH